MNQNYGCCDNSNTCGCGCGCGYEGGCNTVPAAIPLTPELVKAYYETNPNTEAFTTINQGQLALLVAGNNPGTGIPGTGNGTVKTVVAGNGIAVDATDPANPVVSATGVMPKAQFDSASGTIMQGEMLKTFGPKGSLPALPAFGINQGDDPDFQTFKEIHDYMESKLFPANMGMVIGTSPGVQDITVEEMFLATAKVSFTGLHGLSPNISKTVWNLTAGPKIGQAGGAGSIIVGATNVLFAALLGGEIIITDIEVNIMNGFAGTFLGGYYGVIAFSGKLALDKARMSLTYGDGKLREADISYDATVHRSPIATDSFSRWVFGGAIKIKGTGTPHKGVAALTVTGNSTIVVQEEKGGTHLNIENADIGIKVATDSQIFFDTIAGAPKSTFKDLALAFAVYDRSKLISISDDMTMVNVTKEANIPLNEISRDGSLVSTADSEITAMPIPSGTTAKRPATKTIGYQYFDSTLQEVIVYNGTKWDRFAPPVPTADGEYKLKVAAGKLSWIKI